MGKCGEKGAPSVRSDKSVAQGEAATGLSHLLPKGALDRGRFAPKSNSAVAQILRTFHLEAQLRQWIFSHLPTHLGAWCGTSSVCAAPPTTTTTTTSAALKTQAEGSQGRGLPCTLCISVLETEAFSKAKAPHDAGRFWKIPAGD